MGTTPNLNLPYPEPSDYVTDGATAIEQLADTLDAALVNRLIPTGTVQMFAGAAAPAGWLVCDGSNVSRTTFAALFAVIGITYGPGNGTTTFTLPNLRGRVPVGQDPTDATFDALGETGGAKTHTLTAAEIGKTITVTASYTDNGGTAESVSSAASATTGYHRHVHSARDSTE